MEQGDLLVLRTGFTDAILQMNRDPDLPRLEAIGMGLDGRDEKLLQWITDNGVAAICSDNYAVDFYPPRSLRSLPPEGALQWLGAARHH